MLIMVSHLLREQSNLGLYEATAPLLYVFQTAAVLEVIHHSIAIKLSLVLQG